MQALIDSGDLVRISRELALTRERYEQARKQIAEAISVEGPLTTSHIREILRTSRKYVGH